MTPSEALQAICEAWNRLDNDALADLFDEAGTFEDPLHERVLTGREDIRTVNGPAMASLSECEVTLEHRARARRHRARRGHVPFGARRRRRAHGLPVRDRGRAARRADRALHGVLRHRGRSYERGRARCASARRSRMPIRRSPYFERTLAAGAIDFMVYNHTYMPIDFGRDPLRRVRGDHAGRDALGRRRRAAGAAARPRCAELRRLPQPARAARPRGRPLPLHAGLRSARADHGRLHRAAALRGHRLVLALGRRHLALGLRPRARARRGRGGGGGRRRAAAAAGAARPRPCSSRSTTATSAP